MKKTFLENAYKEKTLIGLRTILLDWGESIIGYVISVEELYFTINEIDEYGFFIGRTIIAIEDVINIEINDRYQKRLKFIQENNSNLNSNSQITIWKDGVNLISHLKELIEAKKITTLFYDEDDYVIGIVLQLDQEDLMIKNIGTEGDEDGISCYPIDKLMGLRYDGINEQKVKILHENRSSFYLE